MPTAAMEAALLDRLWERVGPLLPPAKPMPKGGRPRVDDRACLEGIVYVLRNGLRWRDVPAKYPSGPTCWRRHMEWTGEGVWESVWAIVLQELAELDGVDFEELFADATFTPAQKGGMKSGKPRLARGSRSNSSPTPTESRSGWRRRRRISPRRN